MQARRQRRPKSRSPSDVVALVFCGGESKRLRPISYLMNKAMLPVGPQRKPAVEYIVRHVNYHGIRRIIMVGCDKRSQIANYLGDGSRFGVRIEYQKDPPRCSGTAQALFNTIRNRGLTRHRLLLYYCDILNTVNLSELLSVHERFAPAATIVVSNNYKLPVGVADIQDNGQVKAFREKPPWRSDLAAANAGLGAANTGLACIDSAKLLAACGRSPSSTKRMKDIMADVIPRLVARGSVWAYRTPEPWFHIGAFETYQALEQELAQKKWAQLKKYVAKSDRETSSYKPSVFLSYHIKSGRDLIEGIIVPTLESIGLAVVSGGRLSGLKGAKNVGPGLLAESKIKESGLVLAFVTKTDSSGRVSPNVAAEVGYARGVTQVKVFVERGAKVPSNFSSQFTYDEFDRSDTGSLLRDVVRAARNTLQGQ